VKGGRDGGHIRTGRDIRTGMSNNLLKEDVDEVFVVIPTSFGKGDGMLGCRMSQYVPHGRPRSDNTKKEST